MAAYVALLSLMHTLLHIKIHPRPPISLHQKHVDSLTQNLTFFQDFLERYSSSSSEEDYDLESRIARAAYAAEDVIESHIVDQIHAGSNISTVDLCQGLERVIRDMDLIRKEAMEIIKDNNMGAQLHDQFHRNSSVSTASVKPASPWQISTMAGFDDVLINEVLNKLTGQQDGLQIIPIVGMGGIGKSTFARYIYSKPLIIQHFDILAWVTISQEYSRRNILQVLCQEIKGSNNDLSEMSEDELGEKLYKHLWGRRYVIVMDDVWSIDAWDKVKRFFPGNNNGSKIMITTRLSNLAIQLSGSHDFQMKFLDEDKSWDLFCQIVFNKEGCPEELENIGKEIAKNCRGLPLSIVVIGGLLTKFNMTRGYWQYILKNLSSLINLENHEYCLQVLHTSYKELPMHLKPCFLYMGAFPEDQNIHVSHVVKLWAAEGVLKPMDDRSLEEVAEEYLKELIDRNLIFVSKLGWNGKAKWCKIHDLLRDLSIREAQKQRFICVVSRQQGLNIPEGINKERRVCIHENHKEKYSPQLLHASLARSLLSVGGFHDLSPSLSLISLRVYSRVDEYSGPVANFHSSIESIFQQVNLRYLSIYVSLPFGFPTSWSLFWNLQTIKIHNNFYWENMIVEIWEIPLLRHVMFNALVLPDPRSYGEDDLVLENLQTLSRIRNLKCSKGVVKRIPNIKTLKLYYGTDNKFKEEGFPNFHLNNLGHLQKLEYLNLECLGNLAISNQEMVKNLTFPNSLKKLTLIGTKFHWEELGTVIGSLPLLEYLRLGEGSCRGPKWKTIEWESCSLKFLEIGWCSDLKYWETDSTDFPSLEHLVLQGLRELEEIPSSIGDIPTLKSIRLVRCSASAADSAKRIKEEQEDNGNDDLLLLIEDDEEDQVASNEDDDDDQVI